MSADFPRVRPAVLQLTSRACLDEYRGFRHVIRNVYTFKLNPTRLQELVHLLADCYDALVGDLMTFCQFLESLGQSDDSPQ